MSLIEPLQERWERGAAVVDGGNGPGAAGRRARGELEDTVLAALWAAPGPMTVAEVKDRVDGAAYTTVLTILTRLHRKGVVERRREGRSHVYAPVDDRAGHAALGMHTLLSRGGDHATVLARFVSELSAEDEQLLKQFLHDDV